MSPALVEAGKNIKSAAENEMTNGRFRKLDQLDSVLISMNSECRQEIG